MDSACAKEMILRNAKGIVHLHSRIRETFTLRSQSAEARRKWEQACAEFHARYDGLAFPGGYQGGGALNRISNGDPEAMEAAVCFLEVHPYIFRSGYMVKDILRRCRQAPLSSRQTERLKAVERKLQEWRQRKLAKKVK
jgi:hypothetical protein